MNEWPLPNLVLVVNNVSIHKVAGIHELIKEHRAWILYLPAYSLDFNPIELTFSTIKGWLCTNWDHVNWEIDAEDGMVYNIFWEAVHAIMADQAKGWFKHCRYTVDE